MCACLRIQVFITIMLTCKIFRMSLFFGIGSKCVCHVVSGFCFVIVQKRNFVVHFYKWLKVVLLQIKKIKIVIFDRFRCVQLKIYVQFFKKKVVISICKCPKDWPNSGHFWSDRKIQFKKFSWTSEILTLKAILYQ